MFIYNNQKQYLYCHQREDFKKHRHIWFCVEETRIDYRQCFMKINVIIYLDLNCA